jgi:hypothetical protein
VSWILLFQLATGLISIVQQIWPKGTGSGQVKKTTVTTAVEAAVNAVGGVLTGGAQKTFQEIGGATIIGDFIEHTVSQLFPDKVVDDVKCQDPTLPQG